MIRIGLVDFDTSHVVAFTQRFNHIDIAPERWVEGGSVVAGFPGDSNIMPERIPGFTEKLQSYGVPMVARLDDLLGRVDAVMIESNQGSRHLERARPFLEAGIPAFIDKPLAQSAAAAAEIMTIARSNNAALMSCSPLRYAPEVQQALDRRADLGEILSAEVWTSAALHDGNPGLLHYGIHGVEMLCTLMGPGCVEVRTVFHPDGEVVTGVWNDGRIGVVRGIRAGNTGFGFAAHYAKGHVMSTVEGDAFYTEMLQRVIKMFTTGEMPIPLGETHEVIAFIDAATESKMRDGLAARVSAPPAS